MDYFVEKAAVDFGSVLESLQNLINKKNSFFFPESKQMT